ncbi:MAG TPA: LysM peptidoglycan-binding domain-containing protein, partial [Terracidiphilus sp.]
PPVLTDTVTVNYSVNLRLVSDLVGAPMDELMALNPSLLHLLTPPDASFDLHLPAGTATLFDQRIALVPEPRRDAWRYHRVAAGDSLASVAREFHVSESELAAANQLRSSDSIQGVQALVVPVPPVAAPSSRKLLYTARKGDTLVTIADRFGASLNQLRRWNKITGIKVETGRRLHVGEPAIVPRAARGHRRSASAATGENPHETAPAGGSSSKRAAHSSAKKAAPTTSKNQHAQSSRNSAAAMKSAPSGAKKSRARKPAAHAKSPAH